MSEGNLDFVLYFEKEMSLNEVKDGLDLIKDRQLEEASNFFANTKIKDFSDWHFESTYISANLYSGSMLINPHGELENKDFLRFFKRFQATFLICTFATESGDSISYAYHDAKKVSAKRVKALLAEKDPNIAFQMALATGRTGEAKKLVDKINLDMRVQGYPLFHYCLKKVINARPLLNLLLDKGIVVKDIDRDGDNVVHAALKGNRMDSYPRIAKRIVEEDPHFDVNQIDSSGNTPLSLAVWGAPAFVKLLLQRGADPNHSSNGKTPLALAMKQYIHNAQIVNNLLDFGADVSVGRENLGGVPFVFYFLRESREVYFFEKDAKKKKTLLNKIKEVTKKLIDKGDDLFYEDSTGGNILGYVCGSEELRNMCIKYGLEKPKFPSVEFEKPSSYISHYMLTGEEEKFITFLSSEKFARIGFYWKLLWFPYFYDLGLVDTLNNLSIDFNNLELMAQQSIIQEFIKKRQSQELKYFLENNKSLSLATPISKWSKDTIYERVMLTRDSILIEAISDLPK